MKTKGNNQATTQFTEGNLNITIQGNIMTVEERGYPDDVYQIVEVAPIGYEVWNIGDHMPKGYIPYAQCGGYDGRQVNRSTLKAVFIGDAKETASCVNIKERKDQQGRNNVNTLRYYAGFMRLLGRGYKNLSIHEKITVRSAYCGNEFPSVMISTLN